MMRLLGLALMVVSLMATATVAKTPAEGDVAPPFELKLVDGSTVTLESLRGNVIVLNFWATWCGPCKKELPLLDAWYRVNGEHGLKIYAITTEDSAPLTALKKLFEAMAIPSVRHVKGPYSPLGALPTNFVIDRAGRIRYAKAGAFDLDGLNELLVPLLNEPAPPAAPKPAP
jgi:thiol-disulfide isomerase/thioredoxin